MIAYIEGLQLVREYLYGGLFAPRIGVSIILLLATVPVFAVIKAKPYPWVRLHGEASGIQMDEKGRHLVFTDPEGYNLSFLHIKEQARPRLRSDQPAFALASRDDPVDHKPRNWTGTLIGIGKQTLIGNVRISHCIDAGQKLIKFYKFFIVST